MLSDLIVENRSCVECSKIWCKFTQNMMQDYADHQFKDGFNIDNKFTILTNIPVNNNRTKEIKIDIQVRQIFYVVDDD